MNFTKPQCLKLCHELWIHVYETGNKMTWPRWKSRGGDVPDFGLHVFDG